MHSQSNNKKKKILSFFLLIILAFMAFLSVMFFTHIKPRDLPSLHAIKSSRAIRGSIVTADGFHVASSFKLNKAIINTKYLDEDKTELFIQLFSIYSGLEPDLIRRKITKKGTVVLSYNIPEKEAQHLKQLSRELTRLKVFKELKNPTTGKLTSQGLSIIESGESREYIYGKLLTPIIGYPQKKEENDYTSIKGVKGLEKRFDDELQAKQNELVQGFRDVNGYVILNKDSFTKMEMNGFDIKLNIPLKLQIKIEQALEKMETTLGAKQVMAVVMETKSGRVISMASSRRFLPKNITKDDYPSLNSSMIEYSFEPGSVIKPIVLAMLLEKKAINPYDMVNGHNGKFQIGQKIITDEHPFGMLSAEEIIIHSSNIGIAQIAQRLNGNDFYRGLDAFGFGKKSTPDLVYEKVGAIPTPAQLNNEIYKATAAYGYGIRANLMQLMRAYSIFNNNGAMTSPRIVEAYIDSRKQLIKIPYEDSVQIIQNTTAQKMKNILIRTVEEGTGTKTKTAGLEIGGKTGTAHIVEGRKYVNKYNTSFVGFANDAKQKYTIGVVVVQPTISQFAAQTSVPVFKNIIDILVADGYLKPNIVQEPSVADPSLNQNQGIAKSNGLNHTQPSI